MKTITLIFAIALVLSGCGGGGGSDSGAGDANSVSAASAEAPVSNKVKLRIVIDPACSAKTGFPLLVFVNGGSAGRIQGPNDYKDVNVNRGSTAIVQIATFFGTVIGPVGIAVGDGTQQVLSC